MLIPWKLGTFEIDFSTDLAWKFMTVHKNDLVYTFLVKRDDRETLTEMEQRVAKYLNKQGHTDIHVVSVISPEISIHPL